jgi:hypothetical protein
MQVSALSSFQKQAPGRFAFGVAPKKPNKGKGEPDDGIPEAIKRRVRIHYDDSTPPILDTQPKPSPRRSSIHVKYGFALAFVAACAVGITATLANSPRVNSKKMEPVITSPTSVSPSPLTEPGRAHFIVNQGNDNRKQPAKGAFFQEPVTVPRRRQNFPHRKRRR